MKENETKRKESEKKIKEGKKISGKMPIGEIVSKYPECVEVMFKYGIHCIGCAASHFENLEQGCKAHGMSDEDIEKMVKEMNEAISKK